MTAPPQDEPQPPPSLNPEKARAAAQRKDRPGKKCQGEAGVVVPVVDRNSCEGKKDCVEVCPYGVFEVRRIDDGDFKQLSLIGKLKSVAHGRQTSYTPKSADCRACGLCVVACPEKAIRLVDVGALSSRLRST
jgi:NAD-dependent dihydropyrimidine dehydrogenase PreA subunit